MRHTNEYVRACENTIETLRAEVAALEAKLVGTAVLYRAQADDGGQDCATEQEARDWLGLPDAEVDDWEIIEVRTRQIAAAGSYRRDTDAKACRPDCDGAVHAADCRWAKFNRTDAKGAK